MKKFSPRRFFILLLPSLLLFCLVTKAMFFSARGYSAQVTKVPPANGKFYRAGEIDTKVTITISYSPLRELRLPRWNGNGWLITNNSFSLDSGNFEDGAGNRLYPAFSNVRSTGGIKTSSCTYAVTYEFPRSQIPRSAKKVILKTRVSDGKGWELPIEVPL